MAVRHGLRDAFRQAGALGALDTRDTARSQSPGPTLALMPESATTTARRSKRDTNIRMPVRPAVLKSSWWRKTSSARRCDHGAEAMRPSEPAAQRGHEAPGRRAQGAAAQDRGQQASQGLPEGVASSRRGRAPGRRPRPPGPPLSKTLPDRSRSARRCRSRSGRRCRLRPGPRPPRCAWPRQDPAGS